MNQAVRTERDRIKEWHKTNRCCYKTWKNGEVRCLFCRKMLKRTK